MNRAGPVFIVDDDEAVRESLEALLDASGFEVETFGSARQFLERCPERPRGCVVADIRMPDMEGLELQQIVAARYPNLSVIIMTGHADVPIAVRAMKQGAIDFVEKPFAEDHMIDCVQRALEAAKGPSAPEAGDELRGRFGSLTPREAEVLEGLVVGLPNKTIAYNLGISPRTVEVHRARVMEKMRAQSLSELVRFAISLGVGPVSPAG